MQYCNSDNYFIAVLELLIIFYEMSKLRLSIVVFWLLFWSY